MHQHGHILFADQNQISKIQQQISEKNHLLINTVSSCVTDVQELSF
jgi:nitrogenase molybdenum-iron protein alpha/beta subunit